MKFNTQKIKTIVINVTLAVFLLVALNFVQASVWSGPTAIPPNESISTPINAGSKIQIKNGALGVSSLLVDGNSLFNGRLSTNEFCFSDGSCLSSWSGITPADPPVVYLRIYPRSGSINSGGRVRLRWNSTNATSCSSNFSSSKATSGRKRLNNVTSTQTYTITCVGDGGTASDVKVMTVVGSSPPPPPPPPPPPTVTLTALPLTVNAGTPTSLKWTSTNATSCSADFKSPIATNNSTGVSVSPTTNTTYSITCSGAGGSVTNTVGVSVNPINYFDAGFDPGGNNGATIGGNMAVYNVVATILHSGSEPRIYLEILNLPANITCSNLPGCNQTYFNAILNQKASKGVSLAPTSSATPGTYNFQFRLWMQDFSGVLIEEEILDAVLTVNAAPPPPGWSPWINRDGPGSSGDWELLSTILKEGRLPASCSVPIDIEVKAVNGVDYTQTGEIVHVGATLGAYCKNREQSDGQCLDYRVRFLCP